MLRKHWNQSSLILYETIRNLIYRCRTPSGKSRYILIIDNKSSVSRSWTKLIIYLTGFELLQRQTKCIVVVWLKEGFRKIKKIWIPGLGSRIGLALAWWGLSSLPGFRIIFSASIQGLWPGRCSRKRTPGLLHRRVLEASGNLTKMLTHLPPALCLDHKWSMTPPRNSHDWEHPLSKGWATDSYGLLLVLRKYLAHFLMQHVNDVFIKGTIFF